MFRFATTVEDFYQYSSAALLSGDTLDKDVLSPSSLTSKIFFLDKGVVYGGISILYPSINTPENSLCIEGVMSARSYRQQFCDLSIDLLDFYSSLFGKVDFYGTLPIWFWSGLASRGLSYVEQGQTNKDPLFVDGCLSLKVHQR